MLTPEDYKRIEEEERYRAELRRRNQWTDTNDARPPNQPARWTPPVPFIIVAVLAACAVIIGIISNSNSSTSDPRSPTARSINPFKPAPVPHQIVRGQITVNPGQSIWYKFVVPDGGGHVTGSFTASGGFGNDIQAAVLDEVNTANWVNGHVSQAFWRTAGQQTAGNIDVVLPPGMYCLAFNNRSAVFSAKQVSVNAQVIY